MALEHATPIVALLIALLLVVLFRSIAAARSKPTYVRRIAGVDAIDEAIGRAAEHGRPISFSTGLTSVGPVLYACLGVLFYVAKRAARLKSNLLLPQRDPQVMLIAQDTILDAYRSEGRSNDFDLNNVRYLSEEQFAFASGYMGMMHRENVGSAFLFGDFAAESLILAEAGQQVGAMQVAASVTPEQVPFFIAACDYTLIGEEIFASAAYLTREPVQLGSLRAQDIAKLSLITLIVLGTLFSTVRSIWPDSILPDIDAIVRASWSSVF